MPRIVNQRDALGTGTTYGMNLTIAEVLAEYPELAPEIARCTAWRDTGAMDRRSRDFERQYPEQRPQLNRGSL